MNLIFVQNVRGFSRNKKKSSDIPLITKTILKLMTIAASEVDAKKEDFVVSR